MTDRDRHDVTARARAWQTLRLAHERVAKRLDTELSRECGLVSNEFDVLLYLRTHTDEPLRISGLLEAVPLSQPALSRLVARLEARGLLARSMVNDDRRAVVVGLTDSGNALIERAMAIHAQVVHETLTGKFTDAEQAALLRTLSRVGQ
ncbi:MAG: MarR family winged helix-turn-helix transcriptional regulator [Thermomicrobiales bacterium]